VNKVVDPLMQELLEEDSPSGIQSLGMDGDATDAAERSFQDIYKDLCIYKDVIYVIDAEDEQKLRKGLSQVKAKYTAKLKDAKLLEEPQMLEFIVHPANPAVQLPKGQIKIQIVLKPQQTVKIHQTIVPSGI
jgi:hypothetical protein